MEDSRNPSKREAHVIRVDEGELKKHGDRYGNPMLNKHP